MWTRWVVAAFVGLAGLALVGCGQESAVAVSKEETRTTSMEPNKIPVAGSPLRVEAGDLVSRLRRADGSLAARARHATLGRPPTGEERRGRQSPPPSS